MQLRGLKKCHFYFNRHKMKFRNIFFSILTVFAINQITQSKNFTMLNSKWFDLTNFICDLVDRVFADEIGMKRIGLIRFKSNIESDFFDDVCKCMKSDYTAMIANLNKVKANFSLEQPSIYIVLTDTFSMVRTIFFNVNNLNILIQTDIVSWFWGYPYLPRFSNMAKYIFVLNTSLSKKARVEDIHNFHILGIFNIVFLYYDENNFIRIAYFNVGIEIIFLTPPNKNRNELLRVPFQSNFKNLTAERPYSIGYRPQKNLKINPNGSVMAKIFYFFDILKKSQNSDYKVIRFSNHKDISTNLSQKIVEMVLNFDPPKPNLPALLTYDTSAYCAYVPIPKSQLQFPLLDAFEWRIWVALTLCVFIMALVWKLFKVRKSFRHSMKIN